MCAEDKCTVCQEHYVADDMVLQLPCKHCFHSDCIGQWLQGSKMCPVCMSEVEELTVGAKGGGASLEQALQENAT